MTWDSSKSIMEDRQSRGISKATLWTHARGTVGSVLVLIFVVGFAGLWSWSFLEFIRLLVEMAVRILTFRPLFP